MKLAIGADFDVSLLSCDCLFCHRCLLFSSFLLISNCFLAALACAGVVLCALSADGEAIAVTDAAIAADIHQTLDVELDLAAQITFDLVVGRDEGMKDTLQKCSSFTRNDAFLTH